MSRLGSDPFYLGDSVYVEVQDGTLKLTTNNGLGPSNTIYLDGRVLEALVSYIEALGEGK